MATIVQKHLKLPVRLHALGNYIWERLVDFDLVERKTGFTLQREIDMAMERLNSRPRKRLGFLTPAQVFFKSGFAFQI